MHSVELLAEALNKYEGSYILVSHDRYFISKTANKIWEIVDYKIKEFKGTYQEWVDWNERMAKIAAEKIKLGVPNLKATEKSNSKQATNSKVEEKPIVKAPQTTQTIINKELQKEQRKLANLEPLLSKAKEEVARLELALGNPDNYSDRIKFVNIEEEYKKAKNNRESLEKEYETVFEKVMEMEG